LVLGRQQIVASTMVTRFNDVQVCGWSIRRANYTIKDFYKVDQDRCQDSVELYGVLQALHIVEGIVSSQPIKPEIQFQISSKAVKHLTKTSNINSIAQKAQIIIADMIRAGCSIYRPARRDKQDAEVLKQAILDITRRSLKNTVTLEEIGWDLKAFNSWRNTLANKKVQSYCKDYEAGRGLIRTGIHFSPRSFPAAELERREGSLISQFLCNHFPSKTYLHRFHLLGEESDSICNCKQAEEDRDHLLFGCSLLAEAREALRSDLEEDISWTSILGNPSRLIPFVKSIANLWVSQGRKWG